MIYAVVPMVRRDLTAKLKKAGADVYPWRKDAYDEPVNHLYLVSYKGTTRELADRLGFDEKEGIDGIVVSMTGNYSGYADKDLWEWLREQKGND